MWQLLFGCRFLQTKEREGAMKEQKPKPKKVVRKVKKSGVVKLKPPTKEEAYKKHIKEATKKSQKEYKDFFIIAWIKKLMGVFNGSNK